MTRISAELTAAQSAKSREVGFIAQVIDDPVNKWEYWAGDTVTKAFFRQNITAFASTELGFFDYRGTAGMCQLSNGNIIRVRNCNPDDITDRQIYIQTITDPTVQAQWESWSVLYTGTHYGVSIQANGVSYNVYHTKVDGFYKNNVKVNVALLTSNGKMPINFVPIPGRVDCGWLRYIQVDPILGGTNRTMGLLYCDSMANWSLDMTNFRRYQIDITGIEDNDGKLCRLESGNLYYGSRDKAHGNAVWVQKHTDYTLAKVTSVTETTAPRAIRGVGGGAGYNYIAGQGVFKLSDGFYYHFMTESRLQGQIVETGGEVWNLSWSTGVVSNPTGLWYDPADTTIVRTVDRLTKKLITIRQSDRVITAQSSALTTYSIVGLSGDPADSTIYWVLEGPWKDGSSVVSKIKKFRKSDNALLATYSLPSGRWNAIKASSTALWLTNWDTDQIHKYDKTGNALASYSIYYNKIRQVNPTGIAVNGTDLFYFFYGTYRILKASESTPTTISRVYDTHNTNILGGEWDTTTGVDLFADSENLHRIWKYQLQELLTTDINESGSNLGNIPLWSRSKDLYNWSDPVVGPGAVDAMPIAGLVESGGYAYWADNGAVWRRLTAETVHDISNYVPNCEFEIPRGNQAASGKMTAANPDGVNDVIVPLSDRELVLKAGLRTSTGAFEFVEFDRFFLKRCTRKIDGKINRIDIPFTDLWGRLENPLRDTFNFVGKTDYDDWASGKRNESFNYYFAQDTAPVQDSSAGTLNTTGDVLYTGWRGLNPKFFARFSSYSGAIGLIARYKDSSNFVKLVKSSGTLSLYEVVANTATLITSVSVSGTISNTCTLGLAFYWNRCEVYYEGVNVTTVSFSDRDWSLTEPGYVGFSMISPNRYTLDSFSLEDWEYDLTVADLVKTALALGDFHDATVTDAEAKAYAIIWGPQTDLPSAAEALRQLMVTSKLNLAWRGTGIEVSQFSDPTIVATLQDEIIETAEEDESQQRVNWVQVDGNENFWVEIDVEDAADRGRMVVAYFDLPELLDLETVSARAREEMSKTTVGNSPGGQIIARYDLWRMDRITWIDNAGNTKDVRIEGIQMEINQGKEPSHRMTLDNGTIPPEDAVKVTS